ncbi:MAG: hypothetical protein J6W61_04515, partial [Bacteroidales bacterium]|nr:hypothetical protein [Bacteroidales bacterium]
MIFFNVTALFGQTHVSNGSDSGQNTVDVPCASVEYILRYSCDFTATPHASSKYSLYVWWNWDPDNPGSPDVRYTNTGTIPSSQILFNVTPTGGDTYSVTVRASHVYSDVNCSYQAHMRLYYRDDDGDGQLHPIEATDQDQVFPV